MSKFSIRKNPKTKMFVLTVKYHDGKPKKINHSTNRKLLERQKLLYINSKAFEGEIPMFMFN